MASVDIFVTKSLIVFTWIGLFFLLMNKKLLWFLCSFLIFKYSIYAFITDSGTSTTLDFLNLAISEVI